MKNLLIILSLMLSVSSFSQVVINEVMHFPGPNTSTNQGLKRKEYIEIYNNSCSPVDIGCWILGNSMYGALGNYIGAFQFPSGTIIGSKSHLVIGSNTSQNGTPYPAGSIDFDLTTVAAAFACDPNSKWLMPNTVGMVALYDLTGTVKDAIYWGASATTITTDTDFDSGLHPCKPAGAGNTCPAISGNLKNAKEIYIATPSLINYVGAGTGADKTFSRIPDGGTWSRNISPSIIGNNCNGGTCATSFVTPAIVAQPSCGGSNGSIVINPNPSGTYVYTWTPNVSSTNSASNLVAGSYTINVNANGCQKDTTINLVSGSGPTAVVTTLTNPGCGASNGQVVIGSVTGGVAPYQYNFNGLGYSTTTTYSGLASGSYTLLVKDANGCIYTASNIVLSSNSGPTAVATTPTDPSCGASNGQVVIGSVTGGALPYQYNFNNLGYTASTSYTGLAAGTYSLIVKDANGCTYNASNIILSNGTGPTAINVTPTNPSCGASNGQVVLGAVTGGVSPFQYNFNNTGYSTTTSYTGLSSGTFTLSVKDFNGCVYNASNIILTNGNGPSSIITIVENEKCTLSNGEVSLFTVTGGVSPYQYNFNNLGYSSTTLYSGLSAGSYSLLVKDANGCIYTANNIVLSNSSGPTNVATTKVDETCSSSNGQITIGVVTGGVAPYKFDFNGSGYNSILAHSNLSAASYSLSVIDANGCEFVSPVIVILNTPGPTDLNISFVDAKCEKNNGSLIINSVLGGQATYQFRINNGSFTTNQQYSSLSPGQYIVSVKDDNGCTYQKTVTISNIASPIADFEYSPMVISSESQEIQTVNTSSGNIVDYQWIVPNASPINGSTVNFTTTINIQKEGSYPITLIVENQSGCIDSITKYIIVKIDPSIYVPNTFTPDGDAFNNSWLYSLNGYDIERFNVRVFNRWGEIIWESKDPSIYWDGTFEGNLVQSGTYIWTMNIKDDNTDEVFYYKGHINIIY